MNDDPRPAMSAATPADAALLARLLRRHGSLDALRDAGCVIEAHPVLGPRLIASGLGCWADEIEPRHAGRLGRRVVVYRQTSSTQDAARRLLGVGQRRGEGSCATGDDRLPDTDAPQPDPDGTVILADHQTGGRGRLGRRWFAPPGSAILMTAVTRIGQATPDRLMLASCIAVARTVERATGVSAQIRWPNDILIDGRKAAGILVETLGPIALIGIGVNVSAEDHTLPATDAGRTIRSTCLRDHGAAADRLTIIDALLDHLHDALASESDADLCEQWRSRSVLTGQRITVASDTRTLTGRVLDIHPRDGLLLSDDRGALHTLHASTTTLVL